MGFLTRHWIQCNQCSATYYRVKLIFLHASGDTFGSWWDRLGLTKYLNQALKAYIGLSMLALWSMEIGQMDRNRLKWKVKEEKDYGHSQQIKLNNFTMFTVNLWVKRREKRIQSKYAIEEWIWKGFDADNRCCTSNLKLNMFKSYLNDQPLIKEH